MRSVGAYEAKTYLSKLLDEVAKGEAITITRHGVPVAVLAPPPEAGRQNVGATIAAMRKFRKGKSLGGIKLDDLIEAGRRF